MNLITTLEITQNATQEKRLKGRTEGERLKLDLKVLAILRSDKDFQ